MNGGLGYKRQYSTASKQVFQGTNKDIQLDQGGFLLDTTDLVKGQHLHEGHPMIVDESTRKAKPLLLGIIFENAGGTATSYKVKKGHLLSVGKYLARVKGGAAYAITAIDNSNAAYDVITVGTTIGAASAGDLVFASTATGASAAALPGINRLLYRFTIVDDGTSVATAWRATVYARRVPYNADIEAALPRILYSQSK